MFGDTFGTAEILCVTAPVPSGLGDCAVTFNRLADEQMAEGRHT